MATNPFEDVSFSGSEEIASVSNDDLVRVLNFNAPPSIMDTRGGQAVGDTTGGAQRVNDNWADKGIVAIKDASGRTTLTQAAPPGKTNEQSGERKVAALLRAPEAPVYSNAPDTRASVSNIIGKLRATQSSAEAKVLFDSLLSTVAAEKEKIEKDVFSFTESKFGMQAISAQLQESRMLDLADPNFRPGAGDSLTTRKILDELTQVSTIARQEADAALKRNLTYKNYDTLLATAQVEMTRLQKLEDKKNYLDTQNADRSAARKQEREDRIEEKDIDTFSSLSGPQVGRLTILHPEVAGITDERKRAIRIGQLAQGAAKDEKMKEALTTDGDGLLQIALQGNSYAKTLVVAEESRKTGKSEQQVQEMLRKIEKAWADPLFLERELMASKIDPEERKNLMRKINSGKLGLGDKKETSAAKYTMLRAWLSKEATLAFTNDVGSWGTADPSLIAAIQKTREIPAQPNVKNVFAAFVGEATAEERVARALEFKKFMQNAAAKTQDSVFGGPDWTIVNKLIIQESVDRGFFGAIANKAKERLNEPVMFTPMNFWSLAGAIDKAAGTGIGQKTSSFLFGDDKLNKELE